MRRASTKMAALVGVATVLGGCLGHHDKTTVLIDRAECNATTHLTVKTEAVGLKNNLQPEFSASGAKNVPKITWSHVPPNTHEVEIIVEDPNAPGDLPFVHLLVEGIDPAQTEYPGKSGTVAENSEGKTGYSPPDPPRGQIHEYHFEVLAVGKNLDPKPLSRDELFKQMTNHVVASGEAVGSFGQ